jgi:signal transduction histidine kinase
MPQGGVLTVKTENVYVDSPLGSSSYIEVGEYVRLTVEDTGCGVEPKARDRIFDAFFTTKTTGDRKGCGLGLSVVQAIVEDHRGLIDLSSSEGKGSTFSVYLPVCREYPKSSDHKPVTLGRLAQAVQNELDQART